MALRLAGLQTERISRVLAELGPGAHQEARRFLIAMLDDEGRAEVLQLIDRKREQTANGPATGRAEP